MSRIFRHSQQAACGAIQGYVVFFFSSRRRHTRLQGDWSSDVCSSDLIATRGYTTLEPPRTPQTLVHVHADPEELGRVFQPDLAIVSGSADFLAAARTLEPVDGSHRADWTESAHVDFLASLRHQRGPGELDLGDVMQYLRERLSDDAVLTNGARYYTVLCHRFYAFRRYRTQLAPCSGAMGYGIPAAIAAKIVHPERTVVCVSGDGDFLM